MSRTSLDDALWASLMLTMQQIPRAREIPQGLSLGSAMKRHCGGLSRPRCGSAGRVRRGATCRTTWTVGPAFTTVSGAGRCAAGGSWCSRRCARPCPRTGWCCSTARHALRNAQRLRRGAPRCIRCCAQQRGSGMPRPQAVAACALSSMPAQTAQAASCGSCQAPASTQTCAMPRPSCPRANRPAVSLASLRVTQPLTAATY